LIFVIVRIVKGQEVVLTVSPLKNIENIKMDTSKIIKNEIKQKVKKLTDTTVVLYFKDLSHIYDYKIIDKYCSAKNQNYYDSVLRVIKIFDKKSSLIQKIYPNLQMTPWYFLERNCPLRLSRSYITGKNANYNDMDNYCGEIVVADLNFDGLEDFATPINSGADNGPHYAFYIQNKKNRFEYNSYLTENLTWFPEKINDSLMSFTSSVPCGVYGTWYQTFKYDRILIKWKKIENYVIDNRTGRIMK
jgi:hypothetical protein